MDVSKLVEKAEDAVNRRNYDYAIELYLQACKLDPDNPCRQALRAVERRQAQEKGSGFFGKTKIAALSPQLGSLQMMKKWETVIEKCEDILKIDPNSIGTLMSLGKALKNATYTKAATATFEDIKVLNAGGNNKMLIEAARELAHLYEVDNRVNDALDVWGYVSKAVPGDREAAVKWRDLSAKNVTSMIESSTKDGKRGSIARLAQSDEQRKAAEKMDLEKGEVKSEADLDALIKHTKEQIDAAPDDRNAPKLWEKIGTLSQQFGRYDEAKHAFESAREKDPNNPTYRFKLDDLEIQKKGSDLKALQPKAKAGDPEAREKYIKDLEEWHAFKLSSFLERERQYSTDSKIRFDLGTIYFNLAERRKDRAMYDEAIKRFQSTFKDPKFRVESGTKLGQAFDAKGQYDLALKRFDETLAGFPEEIKDERWKTVQYFKALSLQKAGRSDDYKSTLYLIYEVDVGFKDVSKRIEELESGQVANPTE